VVNVNQHFLLIDARLIRRSSSFGSIPEDGGRAFKIRAAHQQRTLAPMDKKPFGQTTFDIARSGRVVEERRQGVC